MLAIPKHTFSLYNVIHNLSIVSRFTINNPVTDKHTVIMDSDQSIKIRNPPMFARGFVVPLVARLCKLSILTAGDCKQMRYGYNIWSANLACYGQ